MRERNVYRQDLKMYVKKIKDCICLKKHGEIYTLECRIKERGLNYYDYNREESFLRSGSMREKKLWLCEESLSTVVQTINDFENLLKEAENGLYNKVYVDLQDYYVYYKRIESNRYNFIIDFGGKRKKNEDEIILLQNKKVPDLMNEIRSGNFWNCCNIDVFFKTPECCREDLFYCAVAGKDDTLERLIRLFYREESILDCKRLERIFTAPVLPRLSKEYDRTYYIDNSTIPGFEMLERSGYQIMHMPNGLMLGHSRKAVTLNPYTKEGVDAAPEKARVISYNDYLKLFGDWFK